jgi:hypothetical protein
MELHRSTNCCCHGLRILMVRRHLLLTAIARTINLWQEIY